MSTKTKIIGIGGVSNGGKTTLAKRLKQYFSQHENKIVETINNDTYFWPEDSPSHVLLPELNHFNWDTLSSIDWDSLTREKDRILQEFQKSAKDSVLILEGHLLLNYRPIADICHHKFCITLTKELSFQRRSVRVYNPPDVPGFFDGCVWPMYEKYLNELKTTSTDIVYIDGSQPFENVFKLALETLKQESPSK